MEYNNQITYIFFYLTLVFVVYGLPVLYFPQSPIFFTGFQEAVGYMLNTK